MAKSKVKAKPAKKFKSIARKPAAARKVRVLPAGMPWITPYLSVRNGVAAIAFYEKVFGFRKRFEMKDPQGRLRHGEVQHNTGLVMLGEPMPEMGYKSPADVGGSPVSLYVYVENVDAITEAARAAGAKIVQEPKDQFYGDRTAEIVDPEGHRWSFATHFKDVKPEEMKG